MHLFYVITSVLKASHLQGPEESWVRRWHSSLVSGVGRGYRWPYGFPLQTILPPGDIWQSLETFLVVTWWETPSQEKPGMLLNILQCPTLTPKTCWPVVSAVFKSQQWHLRPSGGVGQSAAPRGSCYLLFCRVIVGVGVLQKVLGKIHKRRNHK